MASSARLGVLPLDAVDPASGEAVRAVSIAIGLPIG